MPIDTHAVLEDRDGSHALIFERVLADPPARVWRALVTPEELTDWHPTPFELDPSPEAPGGRVAFIATEGAPEMPDGELLAYDPPRLLAHTWGEDQLRWELCEHGDGCLLRLTQIFPDRFKAARDAAGWHLCLRALTDSLRRSAAPMRGDSGGLPDGWQELNRDYQKRFGIAPEQATPPPVATT